MSWRNIEKNAYNILNLLSETETVMVFDVETDGLEQDANNINFSAIRYKVMTDYSLQKMD